MNRCLLLNNAFEFLDLISSRKAIKHMINGKVEVINYWSENDKFSPSILRLKHYVRPHLKNIKCCRETVFKRDGYKCQYCGHMPNNYKDLEMDHVVPSSLGGKTSFQNCVAACKACNLHKANRSLNQIGFKLAKEPKIPKFSFEFMFKQGGPIAPEWEIYMPH